MSTLPVEQWSVLLRALIPIAEDSETYGERMEASGFSAWKPSVLFLESYAADDHELAAHRTYRIECAKNTIARPLSFLMMPGSNHLYYFSPYIKRLLDEIDQANGVPERQLVEKYSWVEASWRREVDPCGRRNALDRIKNKDLFEARNQAVEDEARSLLQAEVERFATPMSRAFTFDRVGRYDFLTEALKRDAHPLGFAHSKKKSYPDDPVFEKHCIGDWYLTIAVKERQFFFGGFQPRVAWSWDSKSGIAISAITAQDGV